MFDWYYMGDCGVAVSIDIEINGFPKRIQGWHKNNEKLAIKNLKKNLKSIVTQVQGLIADIEEGNDLK